MHKYTKQDELLVKQFLESMYNKHQQIRGSSMGGSATGGSGFTDFVHGFLTPFKQFGSIVNEVVPGLGSVLSLGATGIDKLVPGHQYETIGDLLSNKHIEGTGMGGSRRGRPKKVKVEVSIVPVKKRGRPRKS